MFALMFLAAAAIYVVIGGLILKRISSRWLKGLVVVIWILIPTGDEIAGHLYLNHLCSTEAGVKVYQTVELPAEYWDAQGKPKFLKENSDLNYSFLKNRFRESTSEKVYPSLFKIDEMHYKLVDNSNQKVLGEVINFMYWGGWVVRDFSPHNNAVDCKEFHGKQFWHNFYVRFFQPVASIQ